MALAMACFWGSIRNCERDLDTIGNATAVCETSFKIDFFTEPQNPRRESRTT